MEWFRWLLLIFATALSFAWIFFAVAGGKKYRGYTDSKFAQEFQLSQLFCVGFFVMEVFHISTKSRNAQIRIKEIAEIRGKKYAEYYYYILVGAKITYIFTILVFVLLLAVLADSIELFLLGLVIGGLAAAYLDLSLQDKLTARRQELVLDLPQVLSKLTLLVNSGMVLREAWKRVAVTGERTLYKEMQNTSLEIDNGVMEIDAYRNFADRCNVKEIRKFTSLVIQNLKKGNEELAYFLKDLSDEMWECKKNEVKQKGEKANSKLLLPMMLIFLGILMLILVPVFQQMG